MNALRRYRYVVIAVLLLVLYFLDRGNLAANHPTYWMFVFALVAVMMFRRLDRIEHKLDAISRKEEPSSVI